MMTRRRFATAASASLLLSGMSAEAFSENASKSSWAIELEQIEAKTGGRLGVAIVDVETRRSMLHRENEQFPMCSTAKALTCGAVLARVDAGCDSLDRIIRFSASDLVTYSPATRDHVRDGMTLKAVCRAAMTLSDNTAENLMLATLGGPSGVTAFARSLGDERTRLDRCETALNDATPGDPRDTTTPEAMARTLERLVLGSFLSRSLREQLAAWMVANTTGGAKLRAGVPATWTVGDKTGSGGHGTSNDIAVLWKPDGRPMVAAVYLTGAEAVQEAARSSAIAAVGRLAASELI